MVNVAVFSFGRIGSARCPNKMLRPFAGTTLTDILLTKLAHSQRPAFFGGYEPVFRERCERHGVTFLQRDERSVTIDEPITDILRFLEPLDFSHFLCMSAALPFLRLETAEAFLEDCLAHDAKPGFGVIRRANHMMTLDRRPLNFDITGRTINTKTVQPVLEFGHALYFFSKRDLFEQGSLWDWRDVRFIELPSKLEAVDVDTEEDFTFAEYLWKGLHGSGQC
jgi:hypothetical protein